jgi:succinate dehydrogenase/fumarate reductase flavoprotein subunit
MNKRTKERTNEGMDRRDFLKGAALVGAGVVGAGALAACSPGAETDGGGASNAPSGGGAGTTTPAASGSTAAWRTAPQPIAGGEIVEEYSADVVVVGAGHAGIAAAREAAEQGKSVILLDLAEEGAHMAMGNAAGCLNSKYLLNKGIKSIDPIEFYNNWQINTNNGAQPALIMKYAQNSGDANDWFWIDVATEEQLATTTVQFWPRNATERSKMLDNVGLHKFWSSSIDMYGEYSTTVAHNLNIDIIKAKGSQCFTGMHGEQLVTGSGGEVTGVIAKGAAGYVKFSSKAVVLATGGFGGNPEMREDLLHDLYYEQVEGQDNISTMMMDGDGSGIAMAYWIGAKIEEGRTIATMDGRTPWINGTPAMSPSIGYPQGIWLDASGNRFENEFWGPIEFRHRSILVKNRDRFYGVYDSKLADYMEYVPPSHGTTDPTPENLQAVRDAQQAAIEAGSAGYALVSNGFFGETEQMFWYGAATLEDAVGFIDADDKVKQNILNSVKRYNGYVDAKADAEFGRDPAVLFPIKEGPFFVQVIDKNSSIGNLMVTMGGLIVDGEQRVLGDDWLPIPGLFASGNCAGGRFGDDYFSPIYGVSLGICVTLGRECGRSVVQYLNGEL